MEAVMPVISPVFLTLAISLRTHERGGGGGRHRGVRRAVGDVLLVFYFGMPAEGRRPRGDVNATAPPSPEEPATLPSVVRAWHRYVVQFVL